MASPAQAGVSKVLSAKIPDKSQLTNALNAIDSMIGRSQAAQIKLNQGTSQYSLLNNRIDALKIAMTLVEQELISQGEVSQAGQHSKDALEKAMIPLRSLLSKSEKSQQGLSEGSWQYKMLEENIKALNIASSLIEVKCGYAG